MSTYLKVIHLYTVQLFPSDQQYSMIGVHYHAGVAHSVWPFDWLFHNELHEVEDGLGAERRRPRVELIKNAAQRPEISSVVIRLLLHQLRRHIQWCSLDGCQHQGGDTHGPSQSTT